LKRILVKPVETKFELLRTAFYLEENLIEKFTAIGLNQRYLYLNGLLRTQKIFNRKQGRKQGGENALSSLKSKN